MNDALDSNSAKEVDRLRSDLEAVGAVHLDTFLAKLERAVATPSEFNGTVREGVYARYNALAGGLPTFEPKGPKGPDLGITVLPGYANIEIKRLLDREVLDPPEDLEEWWEHENDDDFEPRGKDRWTGKIYGAITGAASQLVPGEANLAVIADWSVSGTGGNFRRATRLLEQEIVENGSYGRLSAVQYDSNFSGGEPSYLWVNPCAAVPLPPQIEEVLRRATQMRAESFVEALWRAVDTSSS